MGGKPFTLPSVWDAGEVVHEGSYFAKYDLRDGFWAVKVAEKSPPYVMVRHPATGRLLWCRSLPFGYKLSPLVFCDMPRGRRRAVRESQKSELWDVESEFFKGFDIWFTWSGFKHISEHIRKRGRE